MAKKSFVLLAAAALATAMWLWVQDIAIPHQQAESATLGVPRGNLSDLYPRWLGARELLLHGRDPYSADITGESQAGYYGRVLDASRPNDPRDQQAFAYPLYVVFILAPTVRLPFSVVQHLWLWLLVALTGASIPLWLRAIGWRCSYDLQLLWIVLVLGCFPAIQGFKLQQLTLLVAALLAASLSALECGYYIPAGILLAFASIKPQLVALPAAWLCLWGVSNWQRPRARRLLWSFLGTMLLMIGASEFLLPGWIREFRQASADYWQYTGGGRSVLDVLLTPLFGRLVSALLVGVLFFSLWRVRHFSQRSAEFAWSLAMVMSTTLAVIPMFAPYNQLLLLPALMVVAGKITALWQASRMSRILLAATVFSVLWPWLASAVLVISLLFLPAATVQRAWQIPLYTNFAIPITVLGLLLVSRKILVMAE